MKLPIRAGSLGLTLAWFFLSAMFATAADPILDWNATLRTVMQTNTSKADPGWSTRTMAMANGAMYDAMMAFNPTHQQYQFIGSAPAGASREAAVTQAAYEIMAHCYPDQAALITAARTAKLSNIVDGNQAAGVAFGSQIAQHYMTWRDGNGGDGSGTLVPYTPQAPGTPGHWQSDPTRPNTQTAWGPNWGAVKTFGIANSNQFSVPAPPALNSAEYAASFDQVKKLGSLVNNPLADRSVDQTDIGIFWAYDRPTMGPPPVLFSRNLHDISLQKGNTPEQNARLFAMASVAMADASIVAWKVKFQHDFWRPVTAIRSGNNDTNDATLGDPNWLPLGAPGNSAGLSTDDFTPPFPAYVSGHATFGGSTFEVLRQFYGSDAYNYRLHSDETMPSGVGDFRDFTTFSQAELENGLSRVYLGVHWDFDSTRGIELGNDIGEYVAANYFQAVPEPSTLGLALAAVPALWWIRRRRSLHS